MGYAFTESVGVIIFIPLFLFARRIVTEINIKIKEDIKEYG